MEPTVNLVKAALQKTNAHGLARLVNEKSLYIRVLWLLAWLASCGAFLRQFALLIMRLAANDVTTNFQSNALPFLFPDLYFCFDSPLSGSRHLALNLTAAQFINQSFAETTKAMNDLCKGLKTSECNQMYDNELALMMLNSLPYRFLVDQLGRVMNQSIIIAALVRTGGMTYQYKKVSMTDFYCPSHLRCFRVNLNDTEKVELQSGGPNKSLYFQLMMDAADSRMGSAALPVLETPAGNMTAPYWALDRDTLYWPDRWSAARLYITEPGHYPSGFDTSVHLEAGRTYSVQLMMSEQVHNEDPSRCVDQHPDVQIVNPYDNSAYTVAYDYAYCYNSAVQAQLKRELNVTCAYLPHPWPPADRSLYNLTSGWGSVQDVRNFLNGKKRLTIEEPHRLCDTAHRCTERTYTDSVNSIVWPSSDSLRNFLQDLEFPGDSELEQFPAMQYLKRIIGNTNSSQLAGDFVRANFLQLQLSVKSARADRTIFVRSYSFESFVADLGGTLGVYLGMSVLTACEMFQLLHDLVCLCLDRRGGKVDLNAERKRMPVEDVETIAIDAKVLRLEQTS